jgi:regulatory protein
MNSQSHEEIIFSSLLNILKKYCAYQERTEYDVIAKATSLKVSAKDTGKAISALKNAGYLNEERFVKAFISGKLQYNQWGRIKMREQLKLKRIPTGLIDKELKLIDPDLYGSVLKSILLKKELSLQTENNAERLNRLLRFAISRGFEYDLIMKVLNEKNEL